jgi:hypothetical protein
MTPQDEAEFTRIVMGMASQKPGKPLTPEGIELFWLSMQDWSIGEFKTAALHLMGTVEFMPNPYHFRQLRKTAGEHSAGEAWANVLHTIRTMHPSGSLPSVDPKTDAVVCQLGGYRALAMTKSDDMHWREKRFAELWEDAGEVVEARKALPATAARLTGPQSFATLLPSLVRQ